MKTKIPFLFLILLSLEGRAQTITYTNLYAVSNQTATLTVQTGQLARVIGANYYGNGRMSYQIGGVGGVYFVDSYNVNFGSVAPSGSAVVPPASVVAGPASVNLTSLGNAPVTCTIELTAPCASNGAMTPSTAVVIPADSGGPVNIILESSTDLINWNAALPGTYGTSTTNRFFRVRATR